MRCRLESLVKHALTEVSFLACSLKSRVFKKKKKKCGDFIIPLSSVLPDPNITTACKDAVIDYRLPSAASTPDCVPIHKTK